MYGYIISGLWIVGLILFILTIFLTVPIILHYRAKGARQMNNDRFLTRVWDKQEKKMIYQGDFFPGEDGDELMFIGITLALVDPAILGSDNEGNVIELYIEDRFVPMMCTGSHDKNKKLLYGEDIIKTPDGRIGKIHFHDALGYFMVKGVGVGNSFADIDFFAGDMFTCPAKSFLADYELLGNKFENPELLEVKV